jgi:peptidoglycan hydrolase-like protein with peptidoglycan-binding domain
VRKGSIAALLAAVWAPAAHACGVAVSQASGPAPLTAVYTATCDSASYQWSFGDGTTAVGQTVTHTFAAGRWGGGLLTDTGAADALPVVTAVGIVLSAPRQGVYRDGVTLSGSVRPASLRIRIYRGASLVTTAAAGAQGHFRTTVRLLGPGPYTARAAGVSSPAATVRVKPLLEARIVGTPTVGEPLTLVARLRPAAAGRLRVRVGKRTAARGSSIRLQLDTSEPRSLRVQVGAVAADGYLAASKTLDVPVVFPELGLGDNGESVRELQRRLTALHYASLGIDGGYGQDTLDAVTAFQKVEGLPRTGRADAALWTKLAQASTPQPRYGGGDHIEVDKTRQVLFAVAGGKVASIVPVSTAGIAGYHTPEGRFAVYRKVAGLDDGPLGPLYDPSYFTGGYAIHGSPSVPPYPASHGCVRVPMWISWHMYSTIPYGEPVYVYS